MSRRHLFCRRHAYLRATAALARFAGNQSIRRQTDGEVPIFPSRRAQQRGDQLNSEGTSSGPDANSEKSQSTPSLPGRLWKWIDRRTGADKILRNSLDEPVPGGARFAYVFGSGLLFIFISQIITGLC